MSLKLKSIRPDRIISALCHRGSHEGNAGKIVCKGRSCACDCHPLNKKIPFCIVCEKRRTDTSDQICRYCKGEKYS